MAKLIPTKNATEDDEFENGAAIFKRTWYTNGGSQLILTSTDGGMVTVQFGTLI